MRLPGLLPTIRDPYNTLRLSPLTSNYASLKLLKSPPNHMSKIRERRSLHEYSIGWLCALPIEATAATAMLDERHDQPIDFDQSTTDENFYTWGCISTHNVVITCLPSGAYGMTSATRTALGLLSSLPQLRFGLFVGIGAGIPESGCDIRLGDVVVGQPNGIHGGMVQYDFGRGKKEGIWEQSGTIAHPPNIVRSAVSRLRSEHELTDNLIPETLSSACRMYPKFARTFGYPGAQHDHLYEGFDDHSTETEVTRGARSDERPLVHYGTIASVNMLVEDRATRRRLYDSVGSDCICLEMEATGLMSDFPCLIIRGICDYADNHKNDIWQRYASATAAALAKELLIHIPKMSLGNMRTINQESKIQSTTYVLDSSLIWDQKARNNEVQRLLQILYTFPYTERKDRSFQRLPGTCEWVTANPIFKSWLHSSNFPLLWITADPGCGKSVLARYLIDEVLPGQDRTVCYFFFKEEFVDQRTATAAGCTLLHQVLCAHRSILRQASIEAVGAYLDGQETSVTQLWTVFFSLLSDIPGDILCVLDGLDECLDSDLPCVIRVMSEACQSIENKGRLKTIFLSRPYAILQQEFEQLPAGTTVLRLRGEENDQREQISLEVDVVIMQRIRRLCSRLRISPEQEQRLANRMTEMPQRTYLWAHLMLQILEQTPNFKKDHVLHVLEAMPSSLEEVYENILAKSSNPRKTSIILALIVGAQRPFTIDELAALLVLNGTQRPFSRMVDSIEPEEHFKSTLQELCGSLVVVADGRVHLLHQTARDFLLSAAILEDSASVTTTTLRTSSWKNSLTDRDVHRCLAERCLWTITLETMSNIPRSLREYASTYWSIHLDAADVGIDDSILDMAERVCSPLERHFDKWFSICLENYLDCCRWDHNRTFVSVLCALGGDYPLVISGFLGLEVLIKRHLTKGRTSHNILSLALWWSISSAQTKATGLLLSNGANPDNTASEALTSVHDARTFLSNIGIADRGLLYRPLHLAASTGQKFTVANLLVSGADPNKKYDHDGKTALHFACHHTDISTVEMLLRYGADTNIQDLDGQTALHLACQHSDLNIVRMLLNYGAGSNIKDLEGHAPWVALLNATAALTKSDRQCHAILELIWETTEEPRDKYGNTVLHLAVDNGCSRCVELCLEHGIDVQAVNEDGLTALQVHQRHHRAGDNVNHEDRLAWVNEYVKVHQLLTTTAQDIQ